MPSIIAEAPTGESTALLSSGHSIEKRLYTSGDVEEGGTESFPRPPVKYFSKLWESYAVALEKNPLPVKAVTAFFILGLGDTAAQGVEALFGSNSGFDWWRAIRFGTFGFLGAPWAHYYYLFLDTAFPPTERPFTPVTIIKLVIDQGVQAPALLALIIAALALLKGIGIVGVKADLKAHYMNTLIANCTFLQKLS